MNVYLDSSVVLRHIFGEPHPLKEWSKIKQGFSSRLLRLECLRTIDRSRLRHHWTSEEISEKLACIHQVFSHVSLLPLSPRVVEKAEMSLSFPLGSLDSLHLASALLWREKHGDDFLFATHDQELALAARSYGLEVIGV